MTRNLDSGPAWLFVAEGATPFPIAGGFAAGRSGEELAEFQDKGREAARPSGWDPVARLDEPGLDGIDAWIPYPTLGWTCATSSRQSVTRVQLARSYSPRSSPWC